MLAIRKPKGSDRKRNCTPNLLPCRINHNGSVNASKRYWSPSESADGKSVAYFRGRKLHGRKVKIPKNYEGVLLSSSHQKLAQEARASEDDELEGEDLPMEVGVMLEQCNFDEFIIWGHEALPDEKGDPYIRAVEEWISLAEAIHGYPLPDEVPHVMTK